MTDVVFDSALQAGCTTVLSAFHDETLRPAIASFFDRATASATHVLHDPASKRAMIVDPVLDFSAAAARTSHTSADAVVDYVTDHNLQVEWIVDTHIHADHLSAAAYLRKKLGGRVAAGSAVHAVQSSFGEMFDLPPSADSFDHLFEDGEQFTLGGLDAIALHVPGHTPADMAIIVGDVVLTGDTIFMPDFGTARADFPGGDAAQLYRSVRRLLQLPDETRLLHCHDYPPVTRGTVAWTSTVGEQRRSNVHVRDGIDETAFVAMRRARDATLVTPALMLASVQVNLRGGQLPEPAANGRRYLKLPLDAL